MSITGQTADVINSMRAQRILPSLPIVVILGGLALVSGLIPPRPPARAAQALPPRAGLVVRFGDGSTRTACVELGPDGAASGEEVLRDSGLSTIRKFEPGQGTLVCKIEQEGCPQENCLCECPMESLGKSCRYWAYYHLGAAGWEYSNVGVSGYTVRDGAVEGWSWGQGDASSGVTPPVISFGEICAPPATATPSPTPSPSPTNTPSPSATAEPTATAAPAPPTPEPIIMPVASSTPPPTLTSAPSPTNAPSPTRTPLPTATASPSSPADLPPTPTEPAPSTLTPAPTDTLAPTVAPTMPAATVMAVASPEALRAGGAAAPATAGPVWLPLVSRPESTATPGSQGLPSDSLAGSMPSTPVDYEGPSTPAAGGALPGGERAAGGWGAAGGGLIWFLALSGTLAVALVAVRLRRGG